MMRARTLVRTMSTFFVPTSTTKDDPNGRLCQPPPSTPSLLSHLNAYSLLLFLALLAHPTLAGSRHYSHHIGEHTLPTNTRTLDVPISLEAGSNHISTARMVRSHEENENSYDGKRVTPQPHHPTSTPATLSTDTSSQDLLSARCQSRCLYEMEQRLITMMAESDSQHSGSERRAQLQVHYATFNSSSSSTNGRVEGDGVVQLAAEIRRQLKHEIGALCQRDHKCSSCTIPCRNEALLEELDDSDSVPATQLCTGVLCKEAAASEECHQSCHFLHSAARRKPGECPRRSNDASTSFSLAAVPPPGAMECLAQCESDANCPEVEKCCVSGCSRLCTKPHINDRRLLPTPEGLTVQERKRRRSAVLRWVMKRMQPEHLTTANSNLYVIQWRWGLSREVKTMGAWQTIAVRNKLYAILKHMLVAGRYYTFRLAAVNRHGSLGFSRSSHPPFRLTKEVKAPTAPANLTLEGIEEDVVNGGWLPTIRWAPPASELPLKDYQLAWWRSNAEFADAYERHAQEGGTNVQPRKQRRDKLSLGENNEGGEWNDAGADGDLDGADSTLMRPMALDRRSTIVPSYSTRASLQPSLRPNEVYMVELAATVATAEGDMKGEPAVMFIRTGGIAPTVMSRRGQQDLSNRRDEPQISFDQGSVAPSFHRLSSSVPDSQLYHMEPPSPTTSFMSAPRRSPTKNPSNNDHYQQHHDPPPTKPPPAYLLPASVERTRQSLMLTHFRADVKPPYFEDGRLRTTLSWLDHPSCQPRSFHPVIHDKNRQKPHPSPPQPPFLVYMRTLDCVNEMAPQEFPVASCVAQLENLQFNCEYFVQVRRAAATTPQHAQGAGDNNNSGVIVTRMTFTTLPCDKTPTVGNTLRCTEGGTAEKNTAVGSTANWVLATPAVDYIGFVRAVTPATSLAAIPATARLTPQAAMVGQAAALSRHSSHAPSTLTTTTMPPSGGLQAKLACIALNHHSVRCEWPGLLSTSTPIGFRAIISNPSTSSDKGVTSTRANVTILPATKRYLVIEGLRPDTTYRFRIQAITAHGLGREFEEQIHLGFMLAQRKTNSAEGVEIGSGIEISTGSEPTFDSHSPTSSADRLKLSYALGAGICTMAMTMTTAMTMIFLLLRQN